MILRQVRLEDASVIALLHARAWQWAYRGQLPDDFLDHLTDPESLARREAFWRQVLGRAPSEGRTWVAEVGGRIVGFASTGPSRDPDAAPGVMELGAIYLDREFAGQGIGRALLARAMTDLRERGYAAVTLWVLETNQRARHFYEEAGWKPDGATKVEERPGFVMREVRYARDLR